jgi:glutaredoxin
MQNKPTIIFYTRPGCHLCEDTAAELFRLADQFGVLVHSVDISKDRAAHDRWWAEIPVVVAGNTTLTAPISPERLRATLIGAFRTGR